MLEMGPTAVLLLGAFAGAVVSSFSGFAFAPVAGVLLLTLLQPRTLIPVLMMCSVIVQIVTLIHLRRSLKFGSIAAMFAGGAVGVPLAVVLFHWIHAEHFQLAFALFLAAYAALMLLRPHSGLRIKGGRRTEIAVGFAGGLVGGLTAMPGAVPVLYCDCKGCPKEVQRATVQPFILGMQVLALTLMVATGAVDREVVGLVAMALPALAAGIAIGLMLFGRVPDAGFRRAVLILLLVTSAGLIVRPSPVRTSEARTVSEPSSAIVPSVTDQPGRASHVFLKAGANPAIKESQP